MTVTLSGRIESIDFVDLLQWLQVRRVSGRLTLERDGLRRTIDWKEGDIVYVAGGAPEDQLGHALLQSRAIPVADLYGVLAENMATRTKLTRIILDGGLLARDRLAEIVEKLARRLLDDAIAWEHGSFEFDSDYQTEDLLQIHLKIKAQVVAFHAAQSRDDAAHRKSARPRPAGSPAASRLGFDREAVEEAFWTIERLIGGSGEVDDTRRHFVGFRKFASELAGALGCRPGLEPVLSDTAGLVTEILQSADSPARQSERVLAAIGLDPFLAADILQLANSLAVSDGERVATPARALRRVGLPAFARLVGLLTAPGREKRSADAPLSRAIRREALSAAYAARELAAKHGIDPEEAAAAALLRPISYANLLDACGSSGLETGNFRVAALEKFRPAAARLRAEAWRLPRRIIDAIAADGGSGEAGFALLLREARRAFPDAALGRLPAKGTRVSISKATRAEVSRVFEVLSLGTP